LLYAKFLQIFVEITDAVNFLCGRRQEFILKLGLINVDLTIFKVFNLGDGFSAFLLVLTPVLFAFLRPLLHKSLILHQLLHVGCALLLRNLLYLLHFLLVCCKRIIKQGFLCHIEAQSSSIR
jgi:hypothetical protein